MSITYWNGQHTPARRVRVVVGDDGRFPQYWARYLVGRERDAVEVTYGGQTFYLDDEDGMGWHKVTVGKGSPRWEHRYLAVERIVADRPRLRGA